LINFFLALKLVLGPGQKFLTRVGSGQPFMVWVWIWKISLKNVKFFNFFLSGQKKSLRVGSESTRVEGRSASYLLHVKGKLGSGRVRAHLYLKLWYWTHNLRSQFSSQVPMTSQRLRSQFCKENYSCQDAFKGIKDQTLYSQSAASTVRENPI